MFFPYTLCHEKCSQPLLMSQIASRKKEIPQSRNSLQKQLHVYHSWVLLISLCTPDCTWNSWPTFRISFVVFGCYALIFYSTCSMCTVVHILFINNALTKDLLQITKEFNGEIWKLTAFIKTVLFFMQNWAFCILNFNPSSSLSAHQCSLN